MRRALIALAVACTAGVAAPAAAVAGAAQPRQLAGCYAYTGNTVGTGYCTTGVYKVVVTCKRTAFPTAWTTIQGRPRSSGTSSATCPTGYIAVTATMVKV